MREAKEHQNLAIQAFFNQMVQATVGKNDPKPKYENLDEMYNFNDEIADIRHQFEGTPPSKRKKKEMFDKQVQERWDRWRAKYERRGT